MFFRNTIIFISILSVVLFSSCGIIKIDFSGAIAQFTDFSDTTYYEDTTNYGCYGPTSPGPCYYIYAPVCGCDGITYGNSCEASRAGILYYTKGKCVNSLFQSPIRYMGKGRGE